MKPTVLRSLLLRALPFALLQLTACQTTESDRDLFLQADADRDGRLSLAEVKAVGLPRLFARFDPDGDGTVSLADVRAVQPDFDAEEFSARDLNRDGRVTFAEYRQVAEKQSVLDGLFAQIDTNRDGFIDRRESDAWTGSLERPPH